MERCPCGTGLNYAECCGSIIEGKPAQTATDLVRARYTAFAKGILDFVQETHAPEVYDDFNRAEAERLNESVQWRGLEIINCTDKENTSTVEFRIHLKGPNGEMTRTSISNFRNENGRWLFVSNELPALNAPVRVKREVGRNDPCPCNSGKKAKKCCGAVKEMTQG